MPHTAPSGPPVAVPGIPGAGPARCVPRVTAPVVTAGHLPAGRVVLLAFQVLHDDRDPVLAAAHELGVLHLAHADAAHVLDNPGADDTGIATAARTQRRLDHAIRRQTARIDHHVTTALPMYRGATLHTETLGALITRLARTWQRWQQVAVLPVKDERVRRASAALAELVDGYDDLIREVHAGRRSLPRRQIPDLDQED